MYIYKKILFWALGTYVGEKVKKIETDMVPISSVMVSQFWTSDRTN